MKWVSHEVVTGMAVYTLTGALVPTACAMAGAVLPDWIEGKGGGVRLPWAGLLAHRGWSHWPVLYLALIGGLAQAKAYFFYDAAFFSVLTWLFIGALLHIAEDAVCGKVPGIFPTQKIGIRLFTVGSFREYLFAGFCIIIVYAGQYILRM